MGLLNQKQQQYYSQGDYGNYQFTSLDDIINNFMATYVGEDKVLPRTNRGDVVFHAHRAMQELSFDTFKSCKAQEITVPASLQMILPQDYVNYTKVSWVDSAGIKHLLYPTSKTSNPQSPQVDANGDFLFAKNSLIDSGNLITNGNFHGGTSNWILNENGSGSGAQTSNTTSSIGNSGNTITAPSQGWFYGYDGNAIGGYDLPQDHAVRQLNVPITNGENYEITYTISNYTSGSYNFVIVDENGDHSSTVSRSANGTYTEIITAGNVAATYDKQTIYFQNTSTVNGNAAIDSVSIVRVGDGETSDTWSNYKSTAPSENQGDYQDDTYWPMEGSRFGLDPQHAQANGSFYIDCVSGKIHFSSNVAGKTVILDYISDGVGRGDIIRGEGGRIVSEYIPVHKFAEEAVYKWIIYGCVSARIDIPENVVMRYKKERFAETRKAKLRLSNFKLEELTQILRGKSKWIKH